MGHPANQFPSTPKPRLRRRSKASASRQAGRDGLLFLKAVDSYLEYRDREAWITRDYSAARTLESYHYRLRALGAFVAAEHLRDRGAVDLDALDDETARRLIREALEDITLEDFSDDTIRDYLYREARRGISARTRNTRLYSFRPFFRWAADTYGDESLDVCLDVRKSRVEPEKKRGVTAGHWQTFVELLDARAEMARHGMRDRVLFKTMRYFGRRISEVVALNLESIYERQDTLVIEYIGKGNKHSAKRLPLYGEAGKLAFVHRYREELEHYRRVVLTRRYRPAAAHAKALFLTQKHQRITVRQVERVFQNLLRECGLDREGYVPHSLRHGFARAKLDDGVGLRKLQKLLDHASIKTTETYLDADEEELTEAMGRGVEED